MTCGLASVLSNGFSTLSLMSWICAQLPQIYTNYITKSAAGISPTFLILWFMGDFLSFTSCLLNDVVLKFQVYLSLFFLCNDVALCYQYYYYNSVYPRKYGAVSSTPDDDDTPPIVHDFTGHQSEAIHIHHASWTASSPLKGNSPDDYQTNITAHAPSVRKSLVVGTAVHAAVAAAQSTEPAADYNHVGLILAWSCTIVYMSSRCPQLYKNYKRKSVEGITPLLFAAALLGNLAYTLSILTSCEFLYGDSKTFFLTELPYILGSSGTIVFDVVYFYQRHIYRDSGRNTMDLEMWNSNPETAP